MPFDTPSRRNPAMSDQSESNEGATDGFSRRTAIRLIAVGTIGAAVGVSSAVVVTRLEKAAPSRFFFLTEGEAAVLIPLCEQIIPRDDAPGATDVGVVDYIDRQLVGALSRHQ